MGTAAFCSRSIACSDPLGTYQLDSFPTQVLRALSTLWGSPSLALPSTVSWELKHLSLLLADETNCLLTFRCSDKISISQTRGDDLLQRVAKIFNKHSVFRNFTRYLGSPEVTQRQISQKVDRQCKGFKPFLWSTGNAAQLLCVKSWRNESKRSRNRFFQLRLIPQWVRNANQGLRDIHGQVGS